MASPTRFTLPPSSAKFLRLSARDRNPAELSELGVTHFAVALFRRRPFGRRIKMAASLIHIWQLLIQYMLTRQSSPIFPSAIRGTRCKCKHASSRQSQTACATEGIAIFCRFTAVCVAGRIASKKWSYPSFRVTCSAVLT